MQVAEVLKVDTSTAQVMSKAGRPSPRPSSQRPGAGATEECLGSVKWYNVEKGFGFVAQDRGGKDVFIHATTLDRSGLSAGILGAFTTPLDGRVSPVRCVRRESGCGRRRTTPRRHLDQRSPRPAPLALSGRRRPTSHSSVRPRPSRAPWQADTAWNPASGQRSLPLTAGVHRGLRLSIQNGTAVPVQRSAKQRRRKRRGRRWWSSHPRGHASQALASVKL